MYFEIKIYSWKRKDIRKKVKFVLHSLHSTSVFTEDAAHVVVRHCSNNTETFKLRNLVKLLEIHVSESPDCLKEGD